MIEMLWLEVAILCAVGVVGLLVFLQLRASVYLISIFDDLAGYFQKLSENPLQKSLEKVHPLAYPLFMLFAPKILGESAGKVGSDVLERLKAMEVT